MKESLFTAGSLDELKIKPSDIQCLEDVAKLPFTVKNDLRTIIRSGSGLFP